MDDADGIESVRESVATALEPDFELIRALGSGRMAHVFLARETGLKRLVAVKVLRPEHGEEESARARFEREANLAAGIKHPQVPSVYRVGRSTSGLPFMVQEYVDGRTLRDQLEATGAMRPDEVRRVLGDVGAALAASHAHGVIHRDLRPENVIVETDTGRAFITDFGLSAARDAADAPLKLTRTGEILGDPRYTSPEQLRGEPVTAQSDVYSIGVLGYELLTCTNPFGSESAQALWTAHLRGEPAELPWNISVQDPGMGSLLKRCLHKDPARRPTAAEASAELRGQDLARPASPDSGGSTHRILSAFPELEAFLYELRRRRVYHVAAAYALVSFVGLQAALLIIEGFAGAPDSLYPTLVILVLAGFPVALVLGWVFDVTQSGIHRTEPTSGGPGRWAWITGLTVGIAIAVGAGWLLLR